MGQFLRGWKLYNTKNIRYMILMPKSFRLMQVSLTASKVQKVQVLARKLYFPTIHEKEVGYAYYYDIKGFIHSRC